METHNPRPLSTANFRAVRILTLKVLLFTLDDWNVLSVLGCFLFLSSWRFTYALSDASLFTLALKRTLYGWSVKVAVPWSCKRGCQVFETRRRHLVDLRLALSLDSSTIPLFDRTNWVYKEKSNLMNMKWILLTNACAASIKILTQCRLTFALIHN